MTARYNTAEIRRKYNSFASKYDFVEGTGDWLLGLPPIRRRFFRTARSPLLEVGVGTGKTLVNWRGLDEVVACDLSEAMLAQAKEKALRKRMDAVRFLQASSQQLPFADDYFKTVVSSQTLCTVEDPVAALREMGRVCHPEGRILLIEHGPSSVGLIDRWIVHTEAAQAEALACHAHRDHPALVEEAGLTILSLRRSHFGIFYRIEAAPGSF